MKAAITYDLKQDYLALGMSPEAAAEFDSPETVEAIATVLAERGFSVQRVGHVAELALALGRGERWDLVFNIAEGVAGFGREAQVPALLDAFGVPYTFADPLGQCVCLHKGVAKRMVRDAGLITADFALIEEPAQAMSVDLPMPLFAKPVAEGTSKGVTAISKVTSRRQLAEVCQELLATFAQPVLVETYLPGREFTVGLLGEGAHTRALGVLEVGLGAGAEQCGYTYENKEYYEDRVSYRLADDPEDAAAWAARDLAVRAWQVLGGRDAGRVDVRLDAQGRPAFIEANPLPGLNPSRSDLPILCRHLGMPYTQLINAIVDAALARAVHQPQRSPFASPDWAALARQPQKAAA